MITKGPLERFFSFSYLQIVPAGFKDPRKTAFESRKFLSTLNSVVKFLFKVQRVLIAGFRLQIKVLEIYPTELE